MNAAARAVEALQAVLDFDEYGPTKEGEADFSGEAALGLLPKCGVDPRGWMALSQDYLAPHADLEAKDGPQGVHIGDSGDRQPGEPTNPPMGH